jgi:hypothetical protein
VFDELFPPWKGGRIHKVEDELSAKAMPDEDNRLVPILRTCILHQILETSKVLRGHLGRMARAWWGMAYVIRSTEKGISISVSKCFEFIAELYVTTKWAAGEVLISL